MLLGNPLGQKLDTQLSERLLLQIEISLIQLNLLGMNQICVGFEIWKAQFDLQLTPPT